MSKHKYRLIAFGVLALVQVAIPLVMIGNYEEVLSTGNLHKFRTAPIDPYDPFRGRYVSLRFDATTYCTRDPVEWESDQALFARIGQDSLGYATIIEVLDYMPAGEEDWLGVKLSYVYHDGPDNTCLQVTLPFDRFYMEEYKAPAAEDVYFEANTGDSLTVWAAVKINKGKGVIEDVFVNELPIATWVEQQAVSLEGE